LVYGVNNDVSPEACLTLKNARGDSGLNEQFHSDQNHRRHSHGDSRENHRGDSREWGRCLSDNEIILSINQSILFLTWRKQQTATSCPVQTAIKDSFVWVMGPQRFVTLTSCKLAL